MSDLVLVTGAQGYIGGRLVAHLLAEEYRVRTASRSPRKAVGSEPVALDLGSERSIDAACGGARYLVHLAAMNDADCRNDPEAAYAVNTLGTLKLAEAARRAGVERFIYISTAHVYGSPLAGRLTELSPTRPASIYAKTHRDAEDGVLSAHGTMKGIVLRLTNALGCPADAAANAWMLIANDLCRQAVTAKELVLRSNGLQLRDFIVMHDATSAMLHFLHAPAAVLADGLFNLGGARTTSIFDLTQHIATRCEQVFGFRPGIRRPEPAANTPPPDSLDYRIDKLLGTGFVLRGHIDAEIDATLRLCNQAFAGAA